MVWRENLSHLAGNLSRLGARRLMMLAIAGILMVAAITVAGYLLTRPSYEVLYTGLSSSDVSGIGTVLSEARIRYDVSKDGKTVKVAYGEAARARMLLAEKGLPRSAHAGYELFDNIGALGLTSFMQKITLVRALEGELGRTIQSFAGVRAVRVHIVLPRRNSFRRKAASPSASVLIRTDASFQDTTASAIRYLVAGAVPGLDISEVSVLDTNGSLLASGEDRKEAVPRRLLDLEMRVARQIRENVQSTLMPYLGAGNFQVAVAARLNTDRKSVSQTIFDPASRVERSVRDIKEKTTASNSSKTASASLDQELPDAKPASGPAQSNKERRERKERLTNYEISSRRINTISNGYDIARLSIAVVINRKSLETVTGHKLSKAEISSQEKEIADLVRTAAGLSAARGDKLKVSAIDFIQSRQPLPPLAGASLTSQLVKMLPMLVNALIVLAVTGIVIWFGVRPALKMLGAPPADEAAMAAGQIEAGPAAQLDTPEAIVLDDAALSADGSRAAAPDTESEDDLIADIMNSASNTPLKRLRQMISYDEKQAANVIREWLHEETRT